MEVKLHILYVKNHILRSVLSVRKRCTPKQLLLIARLVPFLAFIHFLKAWATIKILKDQPGGAGKWQAHGATTSEPGFKSMPILTGEEADIPPIYFTKLSVWTFLFSFPNSANFQNHFKFVGVAHAFPYKKQSDTDKSFKCFYSSFFVAICLFNSSCSLQSMNWCTIILLPVLRFLKNKYIRFIEIPQGVASK